MSIWGEVRNQARLRHAEHAGSTDSLVPASELIAAAEIATGIKCQKLPAEDPLLDGAAATYNRTRQRIYYSAATETALAAFHLAHEYGHHWLDISEILCRATEINLVTPAEPEMSLVGEADAYSPKERAEAQANLFAREFLLPRDKLRLRYLQTSATAQDIATLIGVPVDLVMQQLADAFFLPDETREAKGPRKEPDPDPTQLKAIEAVRGPHRVRASPGTGKTRALIGKVKRLIDEKVDPKSILVLTYSNLAAQDLARRLHAAVGEAALTIWTGTFHAYGFEILRKYSVEAGFGEEPRLQDRTASLTLLEELLPDLNLAHYLNLVDPILPY